MSRFFSIVNNTNEWAGKIFSFTIALAALVIVVEVILRYGFNKPTVYGLVATTLICVVAHLMGGPYAARYGTHVRIDILYSRWSPRGKAIADLFTSLFLFLGLGLLLYIGIDFTYVAISENVKVSEMWEPIAWPFRIFIPISVFLMLLHYINKFIKDIKTVITGKAQEEVIEPIEGIGE